MHFCRHQAQTSFVYLDLSVFAAKINLFVICRMTMTRKSMSDQKIQEKLRDNLRRVHHQVIKNLQDEVMAPPQQNPERYPVIYGNIFGGFLPEQVSARQFTGASTCIYICAASCIMSTSVYTGVGPVPRHSAPTSWQNSNCVAD